MRKPIIVGNWKMNKTVTESIRMVTELKGLVSGKQEAEIVIAPPFVSIHPAEIAASDTPESAIKDRKPINLLIVFSLTS